MAPSTDLIAGDILCKIKEETDIKIIAVIPYPNFRKICDNNWIKIYDDVLEKADLVKYIYDKYNPESFQARNKWMVNHSSRVIAVYNGAAGGTRNTINYAIKQNIEVVNIIKAEG